MNRRQFLGVVGGVCSSLAGCLESSPLGSETRTFTRQTPYSGPVGCRGDPVAVERTYTDPAGYEDDIEYFPENKTVRYVAATSGGEPALYETTSFEAWASVKSARVGAKRVREETAARLGTDEFSVGVGEPGDTPGATPSRGLAILIRVTTRTRDGEPARTPPIPLARLAHVAPRSAHATISIDGDTFSREVSVFASHVGVSPVSE